MLDGLILGALLTIIAWLLVRAIACADVFKDAPDRDPYLDRLLGEIEGAASVSGGGAETAKSSTLGSHGNSDVRTHRSQGTTR